MYPPGMHCGSLDLHSSLDLPRPWVRNLDIILSKLNGVDPILPSNVKSGSTFTGMGRRLRTRDAEIEDWENFQIYISNSYALPCKGVLMLLLSLGHSLVRRFKAAKREPYRARGSRANIIHVDAVAPIGQIYICAVVVARWHSLSRFLDPDIRKPDARLKTIKSDNALCRRWELFLPSVYVFAVLYNWRLRNLSNMQ